MKQIVFWAATLSMAFATGWMTAGGFPSFQIGDASEGAFGSAVRDALREGSSQKRMQGLASCFDTMRTDQIAEAATVYDRNLNILSDFEIELFFEAWARHDPLAALAHVENWPTMKRERAIDATIHSWAMEEPIAAWQAVTELLDEKPKVRRILIKGLVMGWARSGQPGLIPLMRGLQGDDRGTASAAIVAAQAKRLDVDALHLWADVALKEAQGKEELSRQIFMRVAKALARRDPLTAASWADTHADSKHAANRARHVAEYGLELEPEAIFAWVGSFESEVAEQAIRAGTKRWIARDLPSASAFIEATSLEPHHDSFIDEYVQALARRTQWLDGIAWARRIADRDRRIESLKTVAYVWLRNDQSAAESWLGQSELDATDREAVREAASQSAPVMRRGRQRRGPRGRP